MFERFVWTIGQGSVPDVRSNNDLFFRYLEQYTSDCFLIVEDSQPTRNDRVPFSVKTATTDSTVNN